jgi:NAD(P) transhydrogenase subunit alpha
MSEEFLRAEMDLFARQAMEVDIIITTALIPGRPAPKLITTGMVESMRGGSVIVDLAAEQGGNCALTRPGEIVIEHGVHIVGLTNLPSRMPCQASTLFATNLYNIVEDLCPNKDGTLDLNMEDEIARGLTVVREGEITWASVLPREVSAAPPPQNVEEKPVVEPRVIPPKRRALWSLIGLAAAGLAVLGVGAVAPPDFLSHFTVFVLACLVGWQVIWNVTPALHTPLMSVTNAISGIIVLAALLQISHSSELVTLLAFIAVLVSSINIAGGFLVTQRMLRMFRK